MVQFDELSSGGGECAPAGNRKMERLTRELIGHLAHDDLTIFESRLRAEASGRLLYSLRMQKVLSRASEGGGAAVAEMLANTARTLFDKEGAAEYGRYLSLALEVSRLRCQIKGALHQEARRLPRLSIRQLLQLAEKMMQRVIARDLKTYAEYEAQASVAENERRIHARIGHGNDVRFAVVRAINEVANFASTRDLRRPDAFEKALPHFERILTLSSFLNSLDFLYDNASFGEFYVEHHDTEARVYRLGYADIRLSLIRQLAIRRRMISATTGRRHERFVRKQLRKTCPAVTAHAVDIYLERAGIDYLSTDAVDRLDRQSSLLLQDIGAEDDLVYLAAGQTSRPALLYHLALALRLHALAAHAAASSLPPSRRRTFDCTIHLADVISGLAEESQREAARDAWLDLTLELPANGHFDLLRRPFIRTERDIALPLSDPGFGTWATTVREALNSGGDVGRRYGGVCEEFLAQSFTDSGWRIVGRNIRLADKGTTLTEIDLLLQRDDLLLVVEVKALTGSAVSSYDHWKNRLIIEKGCYQAALAAGHLRAHPDLIASFADRRTMDSIHHIYPLVLTNNATFDGWAYNGVPVAGETVRKAITVGTRVEYYEADTLKVIRADEHLAADMLTTETILAALRNPIELKLSPEQGAVQHLPVEIGGVTFLAPDLAPGVAPSAS